MSHSLKTKPFNLIEALNGAKVITRNGKPIKEVLLLNMNTERNVLAIWDTDCMLYRQDGTATHDLYTDHGSDLLLVIEPDPKLIDSMAMRYRHDFNMLPESEKDAIRTIMTQLWEETAGLGFYKKS